MGVPLERSPGGNHNFCPGVGYINGVKQEVFPKGALPKVVPRGQSLDRGPEMIPQGDSPMGGHIKGYPKGCSQRGVPRRWSHNGAPT
jgi:hypothetical protein